MEKVKMPTIKIHNIETDEIIEREMNADELAQWETDKATIQAEAEAKAAIQAQKQAILARLGLTEDELRIVLGYRIIL